MTALAFTETDIYCAFTDVICQVHESVELQNAMRIAEEAGKR